MAFWEPSECTQVGQDFVLFLRMTCGCQNRLREKVRQRTGESCGVVVKKEVRLFYVGSEGTQQQKRHGNN